MRRPVACCFERPEQLLEKRKGVNIEMKIAVCGKGGYRIKEKQITQL